MKIGLIREGKTPPDKRVALTPKQAHELEQFYPGTKVVVQKSDIRSFKDEAYKSEGLTVQEDLSDCDILMGIKEVPVDMLIPGKTYLFFSHTIKEQPYNREMLRAILDKNIRLIDYECLSRENGARIIGFGRYAGIVGAYNGLLTLGEKFGYYELKPAYLCEDRREMEKELDKLALPPVKIALTGSGRVAKGAMEVLDKAGIRKVLPENYLTGSFDEPVYTQLFPYQYVRRKDRKEYYRDDFYTNPELYVSKFGPYTRTTDILITGHYWDSESPPFFTSEDAQNPEFRIKVVADISCDINGPVACTIRSSRIEDPIYGWNPSTGEETDHTSESAISVMAVDNLPCELPKDASEDFGRDLLDKVMPHLLGDDDQNIIKRATITENGKLTEKYRYLKNYAEGTEKEELTEPE